MEKLCDPVAIGTVTTPHGVRGTLRVKPTGSGRHLREGIEPVVGGRRRRIVRARETPRGFLVDFEGVTTRTEAISMRGAELLLDRAELDAPEDGEFYVADLMGLEATNAAGDRVGVVIDTFESRAHEVLVIGDEGSGFELYVPFTLEHVPEVDLEACRLVVRPPKE